MQKLETRPSESKSVASGYLIAPALYIEKETPCNIILVMNQIEISPRVFFFTLHSGQLVYLPIPHYLNWAVS